VIAYLDCSSGISGDKFLGALVDAGFSSAELQSGLDALGLGVRVSVETAVRGGIAGTAIRLNAQPGQPSRTWSDIRSLIERADLPDPVKTRSIAVFAALAEAEARVHGVAADDVHFHEVGASDSIADIVGTCLGIIVLAIDRLVASPIALGSGIVETRHGTLPVPAPATAELLANVPVEGGTGSGELTTPTGAALVKTLADSYGPPPAMTLRAVGRGAGSRETELPNVASLLLGEPPEEGTPNDSRELVVELATNLDHVTPERMAFAAEALLERGALDVWQEPVVMKKGRAAWVLHVLATPESAADLAEEVMRQTGTLGVRMSTCERVTLAREVLEFETSLGRVRAKVAQMPDGSSVRPEADDVARLAREHRLTFTEVTEILRQEIASQTLETGDA